MIIPTNEQMAIFGANEGVWEYRSYDNEFICYVVRYQKNGKKSFKPFTFLNNELIPKWFVDEEGETIKSRPLYGLNLLKLHPDKNVLIVEGEKTAEAARLLFPEYIVLAWLGGCGMAKNVDLHFLAKRKVCLWPDNDVRGINAMEIIKKNCIDIATTVSIINVSSLGLEPKWDLADFDSDNSEIDFEYIKLLIQDSFNKIKIFEPLSYPHLSEGNNPRPLDTTDNLKHLLKFHQISVRWNMMRRIREVNVPDINFYNEESENASLTYITNLAVLNNFSVRRIDKHLDAIAWDEIYHPVRDWLLSEPLKEPLFNQFLSTIKTSNDELSHILIKRWMVSAIAALFNESNFCAQGVLVLEGAPGTHKSSFIMELVPEPLRAIKGGASLDPSKKDDVFTLSEYWIVELGELDATFKKSDIARLKSHITNDIDDVRRPHAVRNSKMIRRSVYAATVNETRFLVDSTGNRRWWTISITEPIKTRSGINMQQVWREIYELWKNGESPILTEQELKMLNDNNEQYEFIDPFVEKLDIHFDWECTERSWMNSTQVLSVIGYDKPSRNDCTKMGTLLTKMKIPKGIGRLRNSYLMPKSNFERLNV